MKCKELKKILKMVKNDAEIYVNGQKPLVLLQQNERGKWAVELREVKESMEVTNAAAKMDDND